MLKFYSLVSGSSGNSTLISDGKTNILIDCGLNGKNCANKLLSAGVSPENVSAILVTHEHSDHISGVGVMSRRYNIPIYATESTWQGMFSSRCSIGKIAPHNIKTIEKDSEFEVGSVGVCAFKTPHDSADSVGYNIFIGREKFSVATDMGRVDKGVVARLLGSRSVLLEANHDIEMLKNGAYPYWLKMRILGDSGHLSNESSAKIAACLAKNGTKKIMLGHLSNENNSPSAAYETVKNVLKAEGADVDGDVCLGVAQRYEITDLL